MSQSSGAYGSKSDQVESIQPADLDSEIRSIAANDAIREALFPAILAAAQHEDEIYGAIWGRASFIATINIAVVGAIIAAFQFAQGIDDFFRGTALLASVCSLISLIISCGLLLWGIRPQSTNDPFKILDFSSSLAIAPGGAWSTPANSAKRASEMTFCTLARSSHDFARMNRKRQRALKHSIFATKFAVGFMAAGYLFVGIGLLHHQIFAQNEPSNSQRTNR